MLIHPVSVSQTVDAIQSAVFEKREIPARERAQAGKWLAARQGLPGAYADTFAGFDAERAEGIVVFTGERVTSASARHILGEETCRALRLLELRDRAVKDALERANEGLMRCLARAAEDPRNRNPGRFCCCKCSVGLWRNLLAGGLDRQEERLRRGVGLLRSVRNQGQWRGFPFWYTTLALSEMDFQEAKKELEYARETLARAAARKNAKTIYARRRQELARRVLDRL